MRLEELRWPDIRDLDRNTVTILPFGAMEQHGLHCPFMTDALIGGEITRRLDAHFQNQLLILPTMWLGSSDHHLTFPGTISASTDTYIRMAGDIVRSIAGACFQKLLLLNSHGGNQAPLWVVMDNAAREFPKHTIALTTYWVPAAGEIEAIRESEVGGIGHAGEMETSMVMVVRPDTVRVDLFKKDGRVTESEFTMKDMFRPPVVRLSFQMDRMTANGTFGDPATASPEKGEKFYAAVVRVLARVVTEMQENKLT